MPAKNLRNFDGLVMKLETVPPPARVFFTTSSLASAVLGPANVSAMADMNADIGDEPRQVASLKVCLDWLGGGGGNGSSIYDMKHTNAEIECNIIKAWIDNHSDPLFAECPSANPYFDKKQNKNKKAKWDARPMREVKVHPGP